MPLTLTRDQARRFLVRRHLLAPPRSLPATPDSVLDVVGRLGFLQFDPLEVPGARNHDLMLHARVAGYRREWLDGWLYGQDRRLIELYNKSLNIVPLAELPHYRLTWERNFGYTAAMLERERKVADSILGRIRDEGPLSTAAFAEHGHSIDWWWAPTRASRAVLEALFASGQVGISRRAGNRRYYDLIERLVPEDLLALRETEEAAMRHRLISRFRAGGLTIAAGSSELMMGAYTQRDGKRLTGELVESGFLEVVQIEGLSAPRYILAAEREILAVDSPIPPAVTFVAPVDPLVAVRRELRDLWDFEYLWEIFTPLAKRRFGYYVLPILFGDRLVGRIEPRFDKSDRAAGALRILGLWWDDGFSPRQADWFVPAMRDALAAYLAFVGAKRVEWPPALSSMGRLVGRVKPAGAS